MAQSHLDHHMDQNIYINGLATFLHKSYGIQKTNGILLRILFIEKTIKYRGYQTIKTNEYFFLLYYVFRLLVANGGIVLHTLDVVNLAELTAYIVYSYFGPSTSYCMHMFVPRTKNWKSILVYLINNTNLSQQLMNLSTNVDFFNEELRQFLTLNN